MKKWRNRGLTMLIALAGAGLFHLVGLPLPWLLGPMFACLVAAFAQAPLTGYGDFTVMMRTILGVAVGASIKPELFDRMGSMAVSLSFLVPFILLIGLIGYPYFRRVCGLSKPTAYYAAMPGGLQDMLVFGMDAGADVRALSLIHATRVLVVVSLVPFLLELGYGLTISGRPSPGLPFMSMDPVELAIMAFCGIAGWKGAEKLKIFGPSIVGPLILTATASLTGLIDHRPPLEAIAASQLFIGLGVGVKYTGVTLYDIRRTVAAAVGYCLVLAAISFVFERVISGLGYAPPLEALLAYAPGGQAEMAVLAIVAGADVAFVVAHHVVRMVVVILGAPLAYKFLK